ncbi:hypothetical protein OFN63_37495, partial [Escherichia coli]|nr:hypothetical protein [Escherichia coli]
FRLVVLVKIASSISTTLLLTVIVSITQTSPLSGVQQFPSWWPVGHLFSFLSVNGYQACFFSQASKP